MSAKMANQAPGAAAVLAFDYTCAVSQVTNPVGGTVGIVSADVSTCAQTGVRTALAGVGARARTG